MSSTLCGLLLLACAPSLRHGAAGGGAGRHWARRSSIPESSRIARLASGGRHGFAQSLFQVGGNTGSAIGPLVAAAVIVPFGQHSVAWFALAGAAGHRAAAAGEPLVRARTSIAAVQAREPRCSRLALPAARGARRDRGAAGADLLEVLLRRGPEQLLHVLPDRQVRPVGAERAGASVRLPARVARSARWSAARSATASAASR